MIHTFGLKRLSYTETLTLSVGKNEIGRDKLGVTSKKLSENLFTLIVTSSDVKILVVETKDTRPVYIDSKKIQTGKEVPVPLNTDIKVVTGINTVYKVVKLSSKRVEPLKPPQTSPKQPKSPNRRSNMLTSREDTNVEAMEVQKKHTVTPTRRRLINNTMSSSRDDEMSYSSYSTKLKDVSPKYQPPNGTSSVYDTPREQRLYRTHIFNIEAAKAPPPKLMGLSQFPNKAPAPTPRRKLKQGFARKSPKGVRKSPKKGSFQRLLDKHRFKLDDKENKDVSPVNDNYDDDCVIIEVIKKEKRYNGENKETPKRKAEEKAFSPEKRYRSATKAVCKQE